MQQLQMPMELVKPNPTIDDNAGYLRWDHSLGQAGVYRLSSELLLRGTPTWIPTVDFGSDLMTDAGCRIQVKAARLRTQEGRAYYWFGLAKNRKRKAVDRPDFYVLWGFDEDRFWIVPHDQFESKKSCAIPNRRANVRSRKLNKWEGNWEAICGSKKYPQFILDGQAGLQRAICELLQRGIHTSVPVLDTGYDLVATDSTRIQVKTARLIRHQRNWNKLVYQFNLNTSLGRPDAPEKRKVKYSALFDFFALLGIDDSATPTRWRFWIVPAKELDGRDRVFFGPEARWIDPKPIKELRQNGHTYEEIGHKLGIGTMTAYRKINVKETGKFAGTYRMRQYEGRWELINTKR